MLVYARKLAAYTDADTSYTGIQIVAVLYNVK